MTRISGITIESSAPLTPEEKKARSNILNRNPVAVSNAIDSRSRKSAAESGAKLQPAPEPVPFSIKPLFKWFDIWIGVYIDTAKRRIYVFPMPMLGVCIQLPNV